MLGQACNWLYFFTFASSHHKPMKNRKLVSSLKSKIRGQKLKNRLSGLNSHLHIDFLQPIAGFMLMMAVLLFSFQLRAQNIEDIDPMPIKLKGQVLNLDDGSPVPYAFVLNFRTHSGVTTDEQGKFVMDMLNVDSLSISSLGFSKTTVHIPPNYNEMNVQILYAKPVKYAIDEVKVAGEQKKANLYGVPKGKKLDIDPQLRGDAYNKRPPVLAAVFNPISYVQYYASKREREKREAREAILTEKHWDELSQFYTKKLVMELTGLNEYAADNLMMYINSKGLLSHLSTEYDVRNTIMEQFKLYKAEGH